MSDRFPLRKSLASAFWQKTHESLAGFAALRSGHIRDRGLCIPEAELVAQICSGTAKDNRRRIEAAYPAPAQGDNSP